MHNAGQNFHDSWRNKLHNTLCLTFQEIDRLIETGTIDQKMSMAQVKAEVKRTLGWEVQNR